MSKEGELRTYNLCKAVVINNETEYQNALRRQFEKMKIYNPLEAGFVVEELLKEKERLDEKDKWDEEEVQIAKIIRQNKICKPRNDGLE